ncbi:Phytanoyl-CoA dioxygenase [Cinara cedri]|uniref:Phytanoyl-CoA dioxygenase n=1 Tax=Cinara cedri TaxID=506608 RepID=A0A5E4M449_9HEMI|nr:Phytanoyl-CoA dioxygenase [Cinara cedri]
MIYEDLKFKFDRDGFVIIDNFLSEKQVNDLKEAGEKLTQNVPADARKNVFISSQKQVFNSYFLESAEKIGYFFEKNVLDDNGQLLVDSSLALNKVGHALHRLHPVFEECTYTEKVISVCRALGLINPVVSQSMYIYKNPGVGGEVFAHQDSTYQLTTPDTLVGFWFALDDASMENGCLWMIPGSHKYDLHKRLVCDIDGQIDFQGTFPDYDNELYVPAEVKKSSLVLLHGKVIHKSHHNTSQCPRHAYAFHVFDKGVSQYCKYNWLQTKTGFKPLYLE